MHHIIDTTLFRLDAVLERISALKAGDSPQEHSTLALGLIEELFRTYKASLSKLGPKNDPSVVYHHCGVVTQALFDYTPFLGFLHRSRNTSNAFELYGPLLRMAKELLGEDIHLVLSSEWDYSPFTYLGVPNLLHFVWVGLPASESSNALLTPLAGHEFGHSMWARAGLAKKWQPKLEAGILAEIKRRWKDYQRYNPAVTDQQSLTDLFGLQSWRPAYEWALSQSEELFCDFVALRVFGEAYLHAFGYLLAPGAPDRGTPLYPTLPKRVEHQLKAAHKLGVPVPDQHKMMFQPVKAISGSERAFLIELAESATDSLVDELIDEAGSLVAERQTATIRPEEVASAFEAFRLLVPVQGSVTLPEIINAGWRATHEETLWSEYPQISGKRRIVLNELLLKSAQVLEFNTITKTDDSSSG